MNNKQVCEITGITPRRLNYIINNDCLSGMVKYIGRGKSQNFSNINLKEIIVINSLIDIGLTIKSIVKVLNTVDFEKDSIVTARIGEWVLTRKI